MICTRKTDNRAAGEFPANPARDGFALVAVLLFLLVVTAVITPFVLAARTDFLLASSAYRNDRQIHLADGIARLIARQVASSAIEVNDAIRLNSDPMRSFCGNQQVEVRVQDQLSLVDLNAAPTDLLAVGFTATGMSGGDARELADLVAAYRNPDAAGAGNTGENKLSDGFKHSAFEAVEELYEFPGFANMPYRYLSDVFTVYGRRETINANNLPEGLASILPSGPTPQFPFVQNSEELSAFYRIEVTLRALNSRNYGYSGMVIEISGDNTASYAELERTTQPNIVGSEPNEFVQNMRCEQLLGVEVAQWLASQ